MTGPERDPLAANEDRLARLDPVDEARTAFEVWSKEPPYGTPLRDTTMARAAAVHLGNLLATIDRQAAELLEARSAAQAAETRYAALAESITPLPHGAIARRRGCDCSDHLILPDGKVRCGYEGCFLDAPEDDDDCDWEHCPRCWGVAS